MKRLMTGVLIAALLLSQTSIADVFVKTDATTVAAAEQDAEFDGTELEETDPGESVEDEPDKAGPEESVEDEPDKAESEESVEDEPDEAESEEAGDTESDETDEELWEEEIEPDETKSDGVEPDETESNDVESGETESKELETDEDVPAVQDMIDELPSVEEVKAMDMDGQRAAYDRTQEAYDAYMSLSEEQRELITGAEVFEALFAYFNGMTAPLDSDFSGGSGTEDAPYLINTPEDLVLLAKLVNGGETFLGKYFKLTDDIDLSSVCSESSGVSWTPIGWWYKLGECSGFSGTFDGDGHLISGLYIDTSKLTYELGRYTGLFGYVAGGTIKNLGVGGNVAKANGVGGIVGQAAGATVQNCYNTCNFSGDIVAGQYFGGIVGNAAETTVQDCYNTGNVSGGSRVGGIVGYASSGNINIVNCYNTGNVSGRSSQVGGVVGYIAGTRITQMSNCYNTGNVSGRSEVGGVVGYILDTYAQMSNCYYLKSDTVNSELNGVGSSDNFDDTVKGVAEEEFTSGEVAWLLQNGQESQEELVWGQNLGVDNFPGLVYFMKGDKTAKEVLKIIFYGANATGYTPHETYINNGATIKAVSGFEQISSQEQYPAGAYETVCMDSGDGTGDIFGEDTPIMEDNTALYLFYHEKFGSEGGTIDLPYKSSVTKDLDDYMEYGAGTDVAGKFTYEITAGNDDLGASVADRMLAIPDTAALATMLLR